MRRLRPPFMAVLCLSSFFLAAELHAWELKDHRYPDGRIKQLWFPNVPQTARATDPEAKVRSFLQARAADFKINSDLSGLRLIEKRESLLGTHFRYQQMIDDHPIENAQITASVLRDGRISQVSSSLISVPSLRPRKSARIDLERAYDSSWTWLGASGRLRAQPKGELVYWQNDKNLQLSYKIQLSTSEPKGDFTLHVDADTGKVLAARDRRIYSKPKELQDVSRPSKRRAGDRREAFAAFQSARSLVGLAPMSIASGRAQIFEPDPRTALARRDLEDDSPAASFSGAYVQKTLPEISFDGTVYHLQGPWAQLADFDLPTTPPSTSPDGNWLQERGDNAFNDAMTYFHIDQNQRYLQALGYKDQTGLQAAPIEVDSDGANGEDNSYYDPGNNRLAFGHGCVDDNEDADVILHEYFHAIQYAINPNSGGGDYGAMGEGFSDYWAASYNLTLPTARSYFPQEIFSWDAHGESNSCWEGRILNATTARYNPEISYQAHIRFSDGYVSDELWSTPLYQSLLILTEQGIPREEVDRILIEAQFGLGSEVTMRQMAQSIVQTALLLYPEGPHAAVFKEQFAKLEILELPHPILSLALGSLIDSGDNGVTDPNETIKLKFKITNSGTADSSGGALELSSSDPQLTILGANATLPAMPIGATIENEQELSFKVADTAACGSLLAISITFKADGIETRTIPLQFRVGQAQNFSYRLEPRLPIPDASSTGLLSTMPINALGTVSDQLRVGVSIKHTHRGDLRVTLIAPSGKTVVLADQSGFSADDIVGVYPLTLTPKESLNAMVGETRTGSWRLFVQDFATYDVGVLQNWSLEDTSSFVCQ